MAETHPIKQVIDSITVWMGTEGLVEVGAYEPEMYRVGYGGVTRIEACEKPGEYCMLPYVRVWRGDECAAEFIQHKLIGVYFAADPPPVPEAPASAAPEGGWPADHHGQRGCLCIARNHFRGPEDRQKAVGGHRLTGCRKEEG